MRVLHVITGLAAGGAEQQLRLLLRRQRATAEVAVLTNPGSMARAIEAEGTPVHHVGMRGNTDAAALPRLVRLIRAGRYDLVHTHLYRACVYGRIAARVAGVRHIVATEHSLGERCIEGRRRTAGVRGLYLATERLGTTTVAVSTTVAHRLVAWGVPASRIEVVPNGIDVERCRFRPEQRLRLRARLGLPADRFVVGTVGRLVPGKRIDLALRAAQGLAGVSLLIVGDGPQRLALSALADELNVDTRFTGEAANVPDLLSAMDIVVAPSGEETFGLTVIEALACGLPVYYTSCPALDELPVGSAPGAHRVPADPEAVRDALAAAAQAGPHRLRPPAALHRYDIARVAARLDTVYRTVTGQPRRTQPHPTRAEKPWPASPNS
jgi:glycosyltransferase involved in cell wall biosynthesis